MGIRTADWVDGNVLTAQDLKDSIAIASQSAAEMAYKTQQVTGWENSGSLMAEKYTTAGGLQGTVNTASTDAVFGDNEYNLSVTSIGDAINVNITDDYTSSSSLNDSIYGNKYIPTEDIIVDSITYEISNNTSSRTPRTLYIVRINDNNGNVIKSVPTTTSTGTHTVNMESIALQKDVEYIIGVGDSSSSTVSIMSRSIAPLENNYFNYIKGRWMLPLAGGEVSLSSGSTG